MWKSLEHYCCLLIVVGGRFALLGLMMPLTALFVSGSSDIRLYSHLTEHPKNGTTWSGGSALRELVQQCTRKLHFAEGGCDSTETNHTLLSLSSDSHCGFEDFELSKQNLRELARRYHFHFVGDSTIRRLAASFEAVFTGKAPNHHTYHRTVYHNTQGLDALFRWTPLCPQVSEEVTKATQELGRTGQKQLVFITSYGVHEISEARRDIRNLGNESTAELEETITEDAMHRCLDVTNDLVALSQRKEGMRPIVLVLQGNPFRPRDGRFKWMKDLHQRRLIMLQELVAEEGTGKDKEEREKRELRNPKGLSGQVVGGGAGTGMPYMLEDSSSIFDRLECKRKDDIHFYEPVKLTEAQMLWHVVNKIFSCSLFECL